MDVPILRAAVPKLDNGRDHVAALSMTDGAVHLFAANFAPPVEANGSVSLAALANFDPVKQLVGMLKMTIAVASGFPVQIPNGPDGRPVHLPLIADCEGGDIITMAQVVSFRYCGAVVAREAPLLTVEAPDGTRTVWHHTNGGLGWVTRHPWEDDAQGGAAA